MLGETHEATRQQAVGIGGDADDGAAPLHCGCEFGVIGRGLLGLVLVLALEHHHRAGGGDGRLLAQAGAVEDRSTWPEHVGTQQTCNGVDEFDRRHLDDGDRVRVLQPGKCVAVRLESPSELDGDRGVIGWQRTHRYCRVVRISIRRQRQVELLQPIALVAADRESRARLEARAQGVD
ncbi:MAG TPA: hypothetical protein VIJ35_08250 [Bradyrhizobium sp.]